MAEATVTLHGQLSLFVYLCTVLSEVLPRHSAPCSERLRHRASAQSLNDTLNKTQLSLERLSCRGKGSFGCVHCR
jgi:hypothetical protein